VLAALFIAWLQLSPCDAGAVIELDANESLPYFSATLPMDGMAGDIIHAMSKASGMSSYISYKPLSRMISDDSNNDLGDPAFFMRNQHFQAVIPFALTHMALFYYGQGHAGHGNIDSLNALKGRTVGVLKGTIVNRSYLARAGVIFEESYSHDSLFKKLRKGRIDLVVEVDLIGRTVIEKLYPDEQKAFDMHLIPKSEGALAILLSDTQPDAQSFGQRYNRGLRKIIENGCCSASKIDPLEGQNSVQN